MRGRAASETLRTKWSTQKLSEGGKKQKEKKSEGVRGGDSKQISTTRDDEERERSQLRKKKSREKPRKLKMPWEGGGHPRLVVDACVNVTCYKPSGFAGRGRGKPSSKQGMGFGSYLGCSQNPKGGRANLSNDGRQIERGVIGPAAVLGSEW